MQPIRVRIILKSPPIHMPSVDMGSATLDVKAPYREFQGSLKWSIVDGALIVSQLLSDQRDDFITFAAGEWTSIEKVPLSVNTKQKDAAS